MADLEALIRVRKHALEQKQKLLAELYRQAEELEQQKVTLEEQMKEERRKIDESGTIEMLPYYGTYAEAVKERIIDIEDGIEKLNIRIEIACDDMREAFAELKKLEITQERREDEAKEVLEKKESEALDEIAIEGYRRESEGL